MPNVAANALDCFLLVLEAKSAVYPSLTMKALDRVSVSDSGAPFAHFFLDSALFSWLHGKDLFDLAFGSLSRR